MRSYDLGLIGGALPGMAAALGAGSTALGAIVGAAKAGAVIGCFLGGAAMLRHGRRAAIALSGAAFLAGPLLMAAAPSVVVAMAGAPRMLRR